MTTLLGETVSPNRTMVKLPDDRSKYGSIEVVDGTGHVLAGPFSPLGQATRSEAAAHGNASRNPTLPYGNTPGEYAVRGIVSTGLGTSHSARTYGTAGAVVLDPVSGQALTAEQNERTGLLIHGGALNSNGGLRPTFGCVRVANEDLAKIVTAFLLVPSEEDSTYSISDVGTTVINVGPMSPGPSGPDSSNDDTNEEPPKGFGFYPGETSIFV